MARITSRPIGGSGFNGGIDPTITVKGTARCRSNSLITTITVFLRLFSKVVKSSHLGAPNSSSFEAKDNLAPFRPNEGFQGLDHMDSLTSLEAICSTLSHYLVRAMDMSPRSHILMV
jgi:hypothetical protein